MPKKPVLKRKRRTELTPLEERFVDEYLKDLKAGAAVVRAGSDAKHPSQYGYELKRRPHIADAIARKMKKRSEETEIDAKYVLVELARQYREASENVGKGKNTISAERGHALRALDLMGNHIDVNAFRRQVGIGNPDGSEFDYERLTDDEARTLLGILTNAAQRDGGT